MSPFCKFRFDGLGVNCDRCGSWRRGREAPDCPPFITRSEPDGKRLPHIKTLAQNASAHDDYMAMLEAECARENARARAPQTAERRRNK